MEEWRQGDETYYRVGKSHKVHHDCDGFKMVRSSEDDGQQNLINCPAWTSTRPPSSIQTLRYFSTLASQNLMPQQDCTNVCEFEYKMSNCDYLHSLMREIFFPDYFCSFLVFIKERPTVTLVSEKDMWYYSAVWDRKQEKLKYVGWNVFNNHLNTWRKTEEKHSGTHT